MSLWYGIPYKVLKNNACCHVPWNDWPESSYGLQLRQRVRHFLHLLFLTLLVASTLTGCQTIRELFGFGIQKPHVSVLAMAVKKVSFEELDLLIQLKVDNPNDIDLDFESLSYQVAIDQVQVAVGEYMSPIKLQAESHLKIELPLKISTQNAMAIIQTLLTKPNNNAQVHFFAHAVFKSPLGPLNLEFNESRALLKR